MNFFENYFGSLDINESTGQSTVLCPFSHRTESGEPYIESEASAHISENGLYHCKVPSCQSHNYSPGGGLSEAGFMSALQGITYGEATRVLSEMEQHTNETITWATFHENFLSSEMMKSYLQMLGLEGMEHELKLGYRGRGMVFPVFIYGEYMGACDYDPDPPEDQKKAILDKGMGQAIFPFDLWREDERDTFLCAGFKDAAIARKHGLNAVTFTHGEGSFPKLYKRSFKGRKVFICYDNDPGGKDGAIRTATLLKEAGARPFIVDLSLVCAENGEDIHDFFQKYEKTSKDLEDLASKASAFSEEQYEKERNKVYPLVSLQEATSGKVVGQMISSRVSVIADYSQTFRVPDVVVFEKFDSGRDDTMNVGETRTFYLEERNIESILKLVDSGLTEAEIHKNLKMMARIPSNEKYVTIHERSWVSVHKAVVTDDAESEILDEHNLNEAYSPMELTVYSLGDENRLKNGEKYRIFYKAATHPLKAREVVGVVSKVETSDISISKFKVNDSILETMKCFQVQEGQTVRDKMEELFQRSKAFLGPEANRPVFFTTELFYHTPLDFMFDEKRKERAYLEPLIVGESRTHKSATAKGCLRMYELGTFASLKNASVAGLIGGSNGSSNGGFKTRLGVIPRNHKGAVILEEFSGADPNFIKSMTDIRSSNVVTIDRVNGRLTAPAKVRMLTLSNTKKTFGSETNLSLSQYASGVQVLTELIGNKEDINRYDFFVLKGEGESISPTTKVDAVAYPKESYMNRVRWIWSRTPEQVFFTEQVRDYVVRCSDELNLKYNCGIQFLGREAWKKLSRVAIAVAACVCSHDETGQHLKVTEEHVAWAKTWLIRCYDNDLFRLKDYADNELRFNRCDTVDVQVLQAFYNQHENFIKQLEKGTMFTQNQLRILSGLDGAEFNKLSNRLTGASFLEWNGDRVHPSPKFRTAMKRISRTKLKRVGEQ